MCAAFGSRICRSRRKKPCRAWPLQDERLRLHHHSSLPADGISSCWVMSVEKKNWRWIRGPGRFATWEAKSTQGTRGDAPPSSQDLSFLQTPPAKSLGIWEIWYPPAWGISSSSCGPLEAAVRLVLGQGSEPAASTHLATWGFSPNGPTWEEGTEAKSGPR